MSVPTALSQAELRTALLAHSDRYWHAHPFHLRMHQGELSEGDLRSWIANRWYYQKSLPQKDAAVVANCPLPDVRRRWTRRIVDQDGAAEGSGGNAEWLALARAAGMTEEEVRDERYVLPGVRFATDAYVQFARTRPWIEAVAASLTELFSGELMRGRISALREHYPFLDPAGLVYFERRPERADDDASHALDLVLTHCTTAVQQEAALSALSFKCDVLWAMLDAIEHASAG